MVQDKQFDFDSNLPQRSHICFDVRLYLDAVGLFTVQSIRDVSHPILGNQPLRYVVRLSSIHTKGKRTEPCSQHPIQHYVLMCNYIRQRTVCFSIIRLENEASGLRLFSSNSPFLTIRTPPFAYCLGCSCVAVSWLPEQQTKTKKYGLSGISKDSGQ